MRQIDTKPYKIFQDLKKKYSSKIVLINDHSFQVAGTYQAFKNHREYLSHQFKLQGVEVYRWTHDYESLDTSDPKLGLVYVANDSVVNPGIEVWALIGHNARYLVEG